MRVALYHPWVYLRSGVERWMVEVVTRSRHDWTVYTHRYEPDATFPELAGLRVVELAPRVSVERSLRPLVHAAATMARTRLPVGHDVLLVSSEGLGDLLALRARVPTVAYCHTPLKIRHDPAAAALVRTSVPRRLALGTIGPAFDAVDRAAWRRYAHVLVNSTETLARVRAAGLRPAGPVEVLEPGVDGSWLQEHQDGEAFFLVAGRVMWQKNIELAISAVRLLVARGVPVRLVVAGMVDVKSRPYLARLRTLAAGLPVTFEIAPSDRRLRELYAGCTALVFTPRNEDFGMVVLEAMGAGAPVLAVDAGGPRSTVTDGVTGWLRPPTPEAFALVMATALSTDLSRLREAATAAATGRGWEAHVRRLDDVLEAVAAPAGR